MKLAVIMAAVTFVLAFLYRDWWMVAAWLGWTLQALRDERIERAAVRQQPQTVFTGCSGHEAQTWH